MSYPSGPNDPYRNAPYGRQPTQPYGYPQQQGGQPAYGHPQQPPHAQGAYGLSPGVMPGKATAARAMMIIGGSLQTLLMLFSAFGLAFAAREFQSAAGDFRLGVGILYALVTVFFVIGAAGIVMGMQFPGGGNSLRIMSIVWASLIIICGLLAVTAIVGILWIALGATVIALLCQPECTAWFNRPQH